MRGDSENDESDEFIWQAARGDVRLPAGTYALEVDPHTGETRIFDAQGRTVVTSWDASLRRSGFGAGRGQVDTGGRHVNPLRKLARWIDPPDPGYRVPTRVRTPDGSNRPIVLVLGFDGLVWWEYADTEDGP